ncbi:MAG: MFS transporter, partial [Hyphomicrobiales bacterium]|nr:MFS transporter [Hyphomicrobiales bacterium]
MSAEFDASDDAGLAPPRWGPFDSVAFTVILIASTIANIGLAVFDTSSGWLMTTLNADPMAVSMVQIATTLPMFLLTLPAGALADIVDARRLLIVVEILIAVVSAIFAALVTAGAATESALLLTTFLLGGAGALIGPAWLKITPQLVPPQELANAVAANGAAYNMSRAVGPALGGVAIATLGIPSPYWAFSASNLALIAALVWWRSPRKGSNGLPAERLTSAIRTGVRYAANNRYIGATLIRGLAFFPFASAYWALLPLIARSQMNNGPEVYGALLGAVGLGAIVSSFALNWLKAELGPNRLVILGSLVSALALVLFAFAREPGIALLASLLAGASWIVVLACLFVSAQVALPDWVRGRGLAIFLTVHFGAMTIGSAVWGRVASDEGLTVALLAAAVGGIVAIPLTARWRLHAAAGLDLSPSMHWRTPTFARAIDPDRGPVLVTVEYRVAKENCAAFRDSIDEIGRERRRDGAYAWGIFEDAQETGRFMETFLIESWLELRHARQRVTNADRMVEEELRQLL